MNNLEVANKVSIEKFGSEFYSLGDFERSIIIKILAGTVKYYRSGN
jgi:hypothetical protein